MNQKESIRKNKKASPDSTLISRYIDNLNLAPGVVRLIGKGTLIEKGGETVRSASDFSYSAPSYAGNGYRIVGDAGGETSLDVYLLTLTSLRSAQLSLTLFFLPGYTSL
jgi:hypothetical protein